MCYTVSQRRCVYMWQWIIYKYIIFYNKVGCSHVNETVGIVVNVKMQFINYTVNNDMNLLWIFEDMQIATTSE